MASQEKTPGGGQQAGDDLRSTAGDGHPPRGRQANRSTTETQGARVSSRAGSGGGIQTPSRQQK
jgi:hypothetical protein